MPDCISVRQVLQKLGLREAGGNYSTIRQAIQELSIDISHFKGQGWNNGTKRAPKEKRELSLYLNNIHPITSYRLKNRLISEGHFEHRCYSCGLTEWQGGPIPLELEHKDGNHQNNSLDNLELLCPNCHALTDTYRGKNAKRRRIA